MQNLLQLYLMQASTNTNHASICWNPAHEHSCYKQQQNMSSVRLQRCHYNQQKQTDAESRPAVPSCTMYKQITSNAELCPPASPCTLLILLALGSKSTPAALTAPMGADMTQLQALSLVSSSVPILKRMANCLFMFIGPGWPYTLDGLHQNTALADNVLNSVTDGLQQNPALADNVLNSVTDSLHQNTASANNVLNSVTDGISCKEQLWLPVC